ncbi:hypothetical protein SCLARK_001322 [Spiroplasma clarkii]|uniref:PTS transporter subunit EIIB n=1 Tax=Spiroplasma clarkii TaxID=2139 RepID=UPI000B54D5B6|nr:PTS transporter subunit EIIB [Spiroplasma clarkii]ARU91857.1 hypothetical protein SCLARK_001322 [Spiroplasma clarkii]
MKEKKDSKKTAADIAKAFAKNQVQSYTNCMTRLRISVKKKAQLMLIILNQ